MQSFGCSTMSTFEFVISPSTRTFGRSPAVMCKSEAPRSIISSSKTRRLRLDWPVFGAVISIVVGGWWLVLGDGVGGPTTNHRPPASGARFANHLLHRRYPFDHLHPRIHAEREHSLIDGRVANLGGAGVHDDESPDLLTHWHHLIDSLPPLQSRTGAGVAAVPLVEAQVTDACLERGVVKKCE